MGLVYRSLIKAKMAKKTSSEIKDLKKTFTLSLIAFELEAKHILVTTSTTKKPTVPPELVIAYAMLHQ
jgi:hypothetical protein